MKKYFFFGKIVFLSVWAEPSKMDDFFSISIHINDDKTQFWGLFWYLSMVSETLITHFDHFQWQKSFKVIVAIISNCDDKLKLSQTLNVTFVTVLCQLSHKDWFKTILSELSISERFRANGNQEKPDPNSEMKFFLTWFEIVLDLF